MIPKAVAITPEPGLLAFSIKVSIPWLLPARSDH